MGEVIRMAKPRKPRSSANKSNRGGARRPEFVRERLQSGRHVKRGSKSVEFTADDPLLPTEPPSELTGYGADAYRTLEAEQARWESTDGCRAFVRGSDLGAVLTYCRLVDRMQTLLEAGRQAVEESGEVNPAHVTSEIRAIEAAEKAHRQLGYVPGQFAHLHLSEGSDDDRFFED